MHRQVIILFYVHETIATVPNVVFAVIYAEGVFIYPTFSVRGSYMFYLLCGGG